MVAEGVVVLVGAVGRRRTVVLRDGATDRVVRRTVTGTVGLAGVTDRDTGRGTVTEVDGLVGRISRDPVRGRVIGLDGCGRGRGWSFVRGTLFGCDSRGAGGGSGVQVPERIGVLRDGKVMRLGDGALRDALGRRIGDGVYVITPEPVVLRIVTLLGLGGAGLSSRGRTSLLVAAVGFGTVLVVVRLG